MDLSIIILNYNTRDLLKQTLDSISTTLVHEIIVVDNASTDNSVEMVAKKYPQVQLIENKENTGFAAGNNVGLKKATGRYVMLLNSDTSVQVGALETLVAYMDQNPGVGGLTPKLVMPDGSLDWSCHRGAPSLSNTLAYFSGLSKIGILKSVFGGYHQTWKDLKTIHSVDAVSMAAMIFPRTLLETVGYLDEDFFMYAEDLDYCKRIKDKGYEIVYNPEAVVVHYKGQSGTKSKNKKTRSKTRKYFYQTMKQYFRKHYGEVYPSWQLKLVDISIDIVAVVRG